MHNPTIIKAREEKELDEIGTWITALDDSPADHMSMPFGCSSKRKSGNWTTWNPAERESLLVCEQDFAYPQVKPARHRPLSYLVNLTRDARFLAINL